MSSKWPLALLACAALVGCADEIGDDCETALDCSQSGSRACDRTQPGGYCTIRGCERGSCPEEAVCVKFRPEAERLAVTYCMYSCGDDGDCRSDEGYQCTSMGTLGNGMEAEVLDGPNKKFCSAKPREPISLPDAGGNDAAAEDASSPDDAPPMSLPDGG